LSISNADFNDILNSIINIPEPDLTPQQEMVDRVHLKVMTSVDLICTELMDELGKEEADFPTSQMLSIDIAQQRLAEEISKWVESLGELDTRNDDE